MKDIVELAHDFLEAELGPVFIETTEVEPLIDGKEYFAAVFEAISLTQGSGDIVYLTNWGFDDKMTIPGYPSIGSLLAQKADDGVDVRLIMTAGLFLQAHRILGPFQDNFYAAKRMRELKVGENIPLARRVLLDWSGEHRTGTHHQKSVFIRSAGTCVAFVSGIDFLPSRYDARPHAELTWDSSLFTPVPVPLPVGWGWHDAGVRLRGTGVAVVWENFRSRWKEAMTLPKVNVYEVTSQSPKPKPLGAMNPEPAEDEPGPPPATPAVDASCRAVQVLRSRYPYKNKQGDRWSEVPNAGIREIVSVHRKAIGKAEKYVYIEDQYLKDSLTFNSAARTYSIFPELVDAAKRNVKVILVGSGLSDPGDLPIPGLRNRDIDDAGHVKKKLLDELTEDEQKNVAVWRIRWTTVHAKVTIVDDAFASVGSANMHSRSMYGIDTELQAAFVDASEELASVVRKLRIDLWTEHLRLTPAAKIALMPQLMSLETALGIWRSNWSPGTDPDTWRALGKPPGFAVTEAALEPVGQGY